MKDRRSYPTFLWMNHTLINEIIIDSHYEENHADHMSDELILNLVDSLQGKRFRLHSKKREYRYYVFESHVYLEKSYRLVLVMETGKNYIGVVNAFRR